MKTISLGPRKPAYSAPCPALHTPAAYRERRRPALNIPAWQRRSGPEWGARLCHSPFHALIPVSSCPCAHSASAPWTTPRSRRTHGDTTRPPRNGRGDIHIKPAIEKASNRTDKSSVRYGARGSNAGGASMWPLHCVRYDQSVYKVVRYVVPRFFGGKVSLLFFYRRIHGGDRPPLETRTQS